MKLEPLRDAGRATYSSKIGPTCGRSKPDAAQVRVGQRNLRREVALRRADVHEGPVVLQGNARAIVMFAPRLMPVIAARNCFRRAGSA